MGITVFSLIDSNRTMTGDDQSISAKLKLGITFSNDCEFLIACSPACVDVQSFVVSEM